MVCEQASRGTLMMERPRTRKLCTLFKTQDPEIAPDIRSVQIWRIALGITTKNSNLAWEAGE